ncbi:MAG: host-nuclease inhibitor Gam family protein, partial [Ignavibacteria bacterium]|nr:host-nuclease inhibitor Gam family protein [Ignavibacteria bacterium]
MDAPEADFMEELLAEAEKKENSQQDAVFDMVLLEISKIETQIARNFDISAEEVKIINDWALKRNSKLQDRINWLATKLEAFIRERGVKTVDLPHGTLKIRKSQDRLEFFDLDEFMQTTNPALLTLVPATYKPNLAGIKEQIKLYDVVPDG